MAVFAHISDLHIDGGARARARTEAVLRHLAGLPYAFDAVLLTGDLTDHGTDEEYAELRALLDAHVRHPLLVCMGNHDDRAAFRRTLLGEPPSTEPIGRVLRTDSFAVVLCDTSIPGESRGSLSPAALEWLAAELAATPAGTPVLVGFHHPPQPLHVPVIDAIRQFDEAALADLAARHPDVVAFLSGHAHTAAATTFAGRPLLVAPGVVSAIRLPWEAARPGENEIVHLELPPGLAFHVLDEDSRLTTHFRTVPVEG